MPDLLVRNNLSPSLGDLKEVAISSAITGAVAYGAAMAFLPEVVNTRGTLPILGNVSGGWAFAASTAVGSAVADVGTPYLIPVLPEGLVNSTESFIPPAIAGASGYWALMKTDRAAATNSGLVKSVASGAGSYIVGKWVGNMWYKP